MPDPRTTLRLFNEKADKLSRLSFTRSVLANEPSFSVRYEETGGVTVTRTGPDDEAIDAFVLTYRMFVQPRDGISVWQIADLYPTLSIDPTLVAAMAVTREAIDKTLDGKSFIQHGEPPLTRMMIHEVFLYGGLAHMNGPKKEMFDYWASHLDLFTLLQAEFVDILQVLLGAILWIRDKNNFALDEIDSKAPS